MDDDVPEWAPAVGVAIIVAIVGTFALVAAGGWGWFAKFLEGNAATWMGGIGSVAAAVVALYLATRTERQQSKAAREVSVLFKVSLLDGINAVRRGAQFRNIELLRRARADLEQALAIGQALPLQHLPTQDMLFVAMMRSLNARCLATLDAGLNDRPTAFAMLVQEFSGYHAAFYKRHGLPDSEIPE